MKLIIAEKPSVAEKLSPDFLEDSIVTDLKNTEKALHENTITSVFVAISNDDLHTIVTEKTMENGDRITSLNMEQLKNKVNHLKSVYLDTVSDKAFYLKQNSPLIKY